MPGNADAGSHALDDVRARQLLAWQRGERLFVEALIVNIAPAPGENDLLELIYSEIMLRTEAGETCRLDEYVQRFPLFTSRLQRLFTISAARGESQRDRGQIQPVRRDSDRNLLFGLLALQMDFISRDALINALRDWTTRKETPLGQVLVERGDLLTAGRELLEPLVDEHVRRHGEDPAASLASISSVIDGTADWHRVHDVDIAESLAVRRLTRNTRPASVAGGSVASTGRFRVLRPHAEGGLGIVCVARDEELHRDVALKEIKPQFARDAANRNRFTLEAEITGGLEHPGVVPVYGLGQYSDGRPYYAMRFIRGDSLKDAIEQFHFGLRLAKNPSRADANAATVIGESPATSSNPTDVDPSRPVSGTAFQSSEFRKLLGRFIDVCQAIEYAHSRGVLHRDLKPGNIMLGKYGETLVVDWGLAKVAGKDERFAHVDEPTLTPASGSGIENTADGSVVGTPAYMSPEQAAGKLEQLGPATDVYSLGATLYHVLLGRSPFGKLPLKEVLARAQRGEFPRPREANPAIPMSLEAVCLKAMALRPEDRYGSAAAIAADIEHWLADEPVNACRETIVTRAARWSRKHRAWALSGTAALALVAVVSTVAAFWIDHQKDVIASQERAATTLANRNAALALQKSELAAEKTKLAEEAKFFATQSSKRADDLEKKQDELIHETRRANKKADEANEQRIIATKNAELAEKSRIRAEDNLKLADRRLYFADMNLAQLNWEHHRIGPILALLKPYGPGPNTESTREDLRGFEWFYWDHQCHTDLLTLKGDTGRVHCVAFSPDGRQLASAGRDQAVRIRDATTGRELFTLKGHTNEIMSVAYSPDGERLASASWDRTVKIWDTTTGRELLTLNGHTGHVMGVAYSPDGKQLASASLDQTAKIWDATTGRESLTLKGHTGIVWEVAFDPEGKQLATAGLDQTVRVWNAATGEAMLTLKGHASGVHGVVYSPDGKQLASASWDTTVKVRDATTGQELLALNGHTNGVYDVAFSPDGKRLASASWDQTVRIWDASTAQELLVLKGHTGSVRGVSFRRDGKQLASASDDMTVKVWDPSMNLEPLTLNARTRVYDVVFSPDGKLLAVPTDDHTVQVWDATTGQESLTLKGHSRGVYSAAFSPDGKRLASASEDQTVKVWDVTTGLVTLTLKGHTSGVHSVAFSPDGTRLASASWDNSVKIRDAITGQESLTLDGHTSGVECVAFSPDGKRLASAGLDQTVRIWDATTGRELLTLTGHTLRVESVAFSPDGKWLASASLDQTVKIWDATTGQVARTLKKLTHNGLGVAFSPGGERLASASGDQRVQVWDTTTGQESLTLKGHLGEVVGAVFSPDGKRLASAGGDKTIKVWDARPWTPELRAEREALRLIHFLRDQGQPQTQWLEIIEADQTIGESVRQRALRFAREWK